MTDSLPLHAARTAWALLLAMVLLAGSLLVAPSLTTAKGPPEAVRFATFNASLNRNEAGQAISDLSAPHDPSQPATGVNGRRKQAATVAEIIQRTRPEVLLINEFDFEPNNLLATAFQTNYLSISHNLSMSPTASEPIAYPYVFVAESNTGIPSGMDFSNDGMIGGGNDAYGFGAFPGQFGMAVFSQHPIITSEIRTFQKFLWRDMPGALLPDDPATAAVPADWYSPAELAIFRLSSKSHWDVPIDVGGTTVHFLASHPTPPVFDDPPFFPAGVDFNGRRNFDEIRLWADYVTPGAGGYIYDDAGGTGGLKPGSKFVIAGDQNSDPLDGDSINGSIQQLLDHPRINATVTPESTGGTEAAGQGGANPAHLSDPRFDTADFLDSAPGNLRADYVLPSRNLHITGSAVFWPVLADPLSRLTGVFPFPSSDHRMVWVDVKVPGSVRR